MRPNRQLMHIVNAMSPIMSTEEPLRYLINKSKDRAVFHNVTKRCHYEYAFYPSAEDIIEEAFTGYYDEVLRARWYELVEVDSKMIVPGMKTCFLKYAILLPDNSSRLLCLTADWDKKGGTGDGSLTIREAILVQ